MAANPGLRRWEFSVLARDILSATRGLQFDAPVPFTGCDLDEACLSASRGNAAFLGLEDRIGFERRDIGVG